MKKIYNIAVVGLGQVGIYLLNELNIKKKSIETITAKLNRELEIMILKNPDQWIWTHNRWK